jgi:hypothetical protein
MFVRFRKIPNDGRRPRAVRPEASFWIRPREWRQHRRWVIGKEERRQPYRLKVMLIENTRANGKVKQEMVASLGTFDATWLESFYDGMSDVRIDGWRHASLCRRITFWSGVLERMGKIGDNRLNAEDRKRIRRAIHNVIPWPMEAERKEREFLDAKRRFEDKQWWHLHHQKSITLSEKIIRDQLAELESTRQQSADEAEKLFVLGLQVAKAKTEWDAKK